MPAEKLSAIDHLVKPEIPIEEELRKKAEDNSRLYKDKIEKIRRDICPRYMGIPKNITLINRHDICDSCSDLYCPTKE